jgi:threonylcarbamoyladenosine tRNA methylthiotransferase MtaB
MKRNYTREEFMDKLDRINKVNPFAFIGTDVIVGFLDESDKDFEDTYTFLDQTPIDKFHVFRYSERQHTAASYLGKRLPQPTAEQKKQRSQAVISLGKKKYATFIDKHIGKTFQTLLLDKTDDGFRMGLLQNQIPVLIPPGKHRASEIVAVSITHRKGSRLIGKVLS